MLSPSFVAQCSGIQSLYTNFKEPKKLEENQQNPSKKTFLSSVLFRESFRTQNAPRSTHRSYFTSAEALKYHFHLCLCLFSQEFWCLQIESYTKLKSNFYGSKIYKIGS